MLRKNLINHSTGELARYSEEWAVFQAGAVAQALVVALEWAAALEWVAVPGMQEVRE